MDMHAFVRELLPPTAEVQPRGVQLAKQKIRYIDATQYAIETSVKGTLVNYQVGQQLALPLPCPSGYALGYASWPFTHSFLLSGLEFSGPENLPRES